MDDSVLWAVALGTGAFGLLLLTVAGAAAMYLNTRTRARRARDTASVDRSQARAGDLAAADESQARAGDVASTDESQSRADRSAVRRTTAGGFWAWVKAWVFAIVHAGTVSLVLGGITFWEDIAKASDEIQRTGTVTFPKQLLPGTLPGPLGGSASRKRLSQPSGDSEDADQPDAPPHAAAGWEVVDLPEEADADGGG